MLLQSRRLMRTFRFCRSRGRSPSARPKLYQTILQCLSRERGNERFGVALDLVFSKLTGEKAPCSGASFSQILRDWSFTHPAENGRWRRRNWRTTGGSIDFKKRRRHVVWGIYASASISARWTSCPHEPKKTSSPSGKASLRNGLTCTNTPSR